MQFGDQTSSYLDNSKGVPQESILGPTIVIIYIDNLGHDHSDARMHFYADDSAIYHCA